MNGRRPMHVQRSSPVHEGCPSRSGRDAFLSGTPRMKSRRTPMIGDFRSGAQGEVPFWFKGGVLEQPCESGMVIDNHDLSFSVPWRFR